MRLVALAAASLCLSGCALIVGIEDYTNVPRLTSLTPSTGTLVPAFDPDVLSYRLALELPDSALRLTPVANDPEVTIRVGTATVASGSESAGLPLSPGENPISVTVSFPGGETRTYTIVAVQGGDLLEVGIGYAPNADAMDFFGGSVALSGGIAVVGAEHEASAATLVDGDSADDTAPNSGAVYGMVLPGLGASGYVKASNTGINDAFGRAVALDGDLLVVGAPSEDSAATGVGGNQADNSVSNAGAVYVYRRSGTTWAFEAYLKASNTGSGDLFGSAVAVATGSPETIAVGAPGEQSSAMGIDGNQSDNTAGNAGAVYVFVKSGATWSQQAYIKASNTGAGDQFGTSVALSGQILAVGAPQEDSSGPETDNAAIDAGAVYVYERGGAVWSARAYVKPTVIGAMDHFGAAVALDADRLVVGAPGEDSLAVNVNGDALNDDAFGSGAAYVFQGAVVTSWTQEAYVKPTNVATDAGFGMAIDLDSSLLVVGAPYPFVAGEGAAYLYGRGAAGWTPATIIRASNGSSNAGFGYSVAVSQSRILVGAINESSGTPSAGACYLFE